MRCVRFLLAALILCTGSVPVLAKAPGSATCKEYGRGVRICTELDESALSHPGRSTKLRVWVEGEPRPIQVRLHNDSPGVVRLKGGDDQIIHMGCRLHRQVGRKVISVGPGEPQLVARPYSAFPKREAADIAAALAPRLAQIEAELRERRGKLPSNYPAAAVLELLAFTEVEILAVLSYQELAALRGYVQEQFRQARADLARTACLPLQPRAIVASISLSLLLDEAPQEVEFALDRVGRLLSRLTGMAEQNDFTTSLCVTSEPKTGAKFLMRPQAIRKWTIEGITIGDLAVVYRGLYAYRMSQGFKTKRCLNPEKEPCALLNLVDDPQPVFHCKLIDGDGACARKPAPLPAQCQDHG